jgi:hypothetical protein
VYSKMLITSGTLTVQDKFGKVSYIKASFDSFIHFVPCLHVAVR